MSNFKCLLNYILAQDDKVLDKIIEEMIWKVGTIVEEIKFIQKIIRIMYIYKKCLSWQSK